MSNIFSAEYIFKTNVAKVYEGKQLTEKADGRCSTKKMFLKTLQNS